MKRSLSALAWVITLGLIVTLTVSAYAKEKIVAYTTLDEPLARAVFEAFEKDTGIKVEWVRLSTGETVARLEAERKNPQASIWYGGVGLGHIEAKKKGLTTPYKSPAAAAIPANFKDKDNYWTGIYAGPLCFVSNVNRLKELGLEAPASWVDLTKPEYKGHIQMANPTTSGTAYNLIATVVQLWGEEKAFEYLKALHANISQYTKSGSAPGKAAAIGEIPVGIGYAHDQVKLINEGYPLKITFPSEGTGYEVASISLIKGGPQLETAKKLYDWALGERAAAIYASVFVVPFVDVPLKPGAVPISQVKTIDQDDEWAGQNRDRLLERWLNEIYRR
ncbi:MAG: ABC transporter substrate-binding protein [Bacillota bacterium]